MALELGVDEPRLDAGHADAGRSDLLPERLREPHDAPFREVVDGRSRVRHAPRDRGHVHDVASIGMAEQWQRGLRGVEEAEQVHVHHLAPLIGVRALDRAEQHHARVVDQAVEAAHRLVGGMDEVVRARLVGHVDGQGDRASAVALDPALQLLQAIRAPRA